MKILFFCIKFPLASETFVLNQIISFIKNGYEVEILSIYPGDFKNIHDDFYKYDLPSRTSYLYANDPSGEGRLSLLMKRSILLFKYFYKLNVQSFNIKRYGFLSYSLLLPTLSVASDKRYRADVIIAHFGHCGVIANYLRELKIISGKLVTVFHGYDLSAKELLDKYSNDYKKLFLSGDCFLPISNLWKNKLIQMGCPENLTSVIRMGIKTNDFVFQERVIDMDCIKIISVCRLTEKKGLEYAIKACKLLKEKGYKFTYKIIGYGELADHLSNLIKGLQLTDCVELTGFHPQSIVRKILSESNIFLLPSVTANNGDMEGIPVAIMEAMASGLPVITTYHSGIPELVEDSHSGWLCPERDANAIVNALIAAIENPNLYSSVAVNARSKVYECFNEHKEFNKMCSLLERVK